MSIRFQADADLHHKIVLALSRREPSLDFKTATAANLFAPDDPEVLRRCANEGRILVSHDARTMPHHFGAFIQEQDSPGVIIASQRLQISEVVDDLILIRLSTEPAEWVNRICYLPI